MCVLGVVELMAGGTIILAHNSAGPKLDIVVHFDGHKTGYLADDIDSYAAALHTIFQLSPKDRREMREYARESTKRFSEAEFEKGFLRVVEKCFKGSDKWEDISLFNSRRNSFF